MWIRRASQRSRLSLRTTANRLMIDASRLAGPLRRQPVVAVIISVGQLAGDSVELRRERAIRTTKVPVVREKDGVEADTSKWRPLVLPGCGHGFDRIIEGHSQG